MAARENKIMTGRAWSDLAERLGLSPRQEQIAHCLLMGLSDKQVAQKLGVAVPTIRTHLSRLFGKLRVEDRVELIMCLMNEYCEHHCPRGTGAGEGGKIVSDGEA